MSIKQLQGQHKRFVPQLQNIEHTEKNDQEFQSLLSDFISESIKEGIVVTGQVIKVTKDVVIVDVGLKSEGRIPLSEFKKTSSVSLAVDGAGSDTTEEKTKEDVSADGVPNVGDLVRVYVERIEGHRGTVLSREKAKREESWKHLEKLHEAEENVNGIIFGRVKGGFTVDLAGVIAFLPGSQVDVRPIKDISTLMNIEQPFQILKMDKMLGNVVVSRKAILEESRSEARKEMLANITEGMTLDGVIKNITDYGAFVDLGDVDGLLHVTDIKWNKINHPSEVLSIGQEVKVMVTKFNEETKRISLGMKQLEANPWESIKDEFEPGKLMKGKITNMTDYGAFVELKEGAEGLVHSSEIAWGKSGHNALKLLSVGQEVEFVVLDVDIEKHRISLSIKKCQDNPLVQFAKDHPVGSVIKAPISNITDFGLFVTVAENTDGMIHESDLSWEGNGTSLLKDYNKGDEVECKVLKIDIEKDRVALGVKQLTENPYNFDLDDFKKNMVVTCTVTGIKDDGIDVNIDNKAPGFIKRSDLSSEKYEQKPENFKEGDRVDAKIIAIDKSSQSIALSIRARELDERKKAIKEYGSTDSGARLGDILGSALGEAKESLENIKSKK